MAKRLGIRLNLNSILERKLGAKAEAKNQTKEEKKAAEAEAEKARNAERAVKINEGASSTLATDVPESIDPNETAEQKAARTASTARANELKASADETQSEGQAAGEQVKGGEPAGVKSFKDKIHGKKIAQGAALVGLACLLRGVALHADEIKQAQEMEPLARMGMEVETAGSESQDGSHVSLEGLEYYHKFMHGTDSNGNVTSWNQAESYQAEIGQSGGVSPDETLKTLTSGTPFDFLTKGVLDSALSPVCSPVGSTVLLGLSFLGGPFTSVLTGTILAAAIVPQVEGAAANFLAGSAINPFQYGADYGNYVNYGVKIAANDQFQAAGGVILNTDEALTLKQNNSDLEVADFDNQSLTHRLFSPTDGRSLTAKLIDSQNPNVGANFASIAQAIPRIGVSGFNAMSSLFLGRAHAASNYDYSGLPTIAIDQKLLDDSRFENPWANANKAADILDLDAAGDHKYISKAKNCFGDTVLKDSEGRWSVTSGRGDSVTYKDSEKNRCADKSDENWLVVRMFIFDNATYEPMACLAGADDACNELGFGNASSSSISNDGEDDGTAGDVADAGTLYDDSSSVACADGTTDVGIQTGYHAGNPVNIRLCALPGLKSSSPESGDSGISGADGRALVNSRVSEQYLHLIQAAAKGGTTMYAVSSFRSMAHQQVVCGKNAGCSSGSSYAKVAKPGTSNHQMGLAIDFGTSSFETISKGDVWFDWLTQNAGTYGIKNYPAESWHWSPTGN